MTLLGLTALCVAAWALAGWLVRLIHRPDPKDP